jgi:trimethylamine---corrinoid protein Co-methyltransferase
MLAALAGANQIYGAGMIESGVAFDFGQLVMDDEIIRMIRMAVGGIRVDTERLAAGDIAAVGSSGDFLSLDATLLHMRDLSSSVLLDRRVRDDWQAHGASDLAQRARRRALDLLEAHHAEPVDADAAAAMRAIVEEADRRHSVG